MFGAHASTSTTDNKIGDTSPEPQHRAEGVATLAVNTPVGVSAVDPFTLMLFQTFDPENTPVAKGEITGIDADNTYDVTSACPEHGSHTVKATWQGSEITGPNDQSYPLLFVVGALDIEDGGEASEFTD